MATNQVSPMSERFHDWLEECPVQWHRLNVFENTVEYSFEIDGDDEEE